MQTEMSSSPPTGKGASYWRFMFAFWLTYGYFNVFSNNVNKKMNKKALFLATENAEIAENTEILSFFINRGSILRDRIATKDEFHGFTK
jgi:hypothetical protein